MQAALALDEILASLLSLRRALNHSELFRHVQREGVLDWRTTAAMVEAEDAIETAQSNLRNRLT
jgi:hypothetical protein